MGSLNPLESIECFECVFCHLMVQYILVVMKLYGNFFVTVLTTVLS